ncbi:hypothetical protein C0Q70_05886 [Pomacea canaliculata]|uniref:Endonuclease 8-like 3 n=1 Tax=Pomacea canaliculata TaxID=400727 RepID=A0A2T7PMF8_POMCA|nr:hypothetical protein C0Q70_05886 [Pomacea canaliculata]
MVEGPGCKIKGEKIRGKLLKQKAITVAGNAVDREKKVNKKQAIDKWDVTSFHRLIGQNLHEVLTLGKELFMFFGDSCLRVHFLMAGSFRVNGNVLDKDGGKVAAQPSLEIQFSTDHLSFYKCAVEIRPSSACKQKYELMKELDICSTSFNLKRVAAEIMRESERLLCDVLLDQDILPGVGNIIKNEALFDSGLKPDSKVKDLTEEHLFHLLKMTRDFSLLFYKCRSTGTNLSEHMKVYQKKKCCECGTKITITTLGEDNMRVTFFCPKCQTNDLRKPHKLGRMKVFLYALNTVGVALKRVMKQGQNNGRRFFCCPLRKFSCSFFEWAIGYD